MPPLNPAGARSPAVMFAHGNGELIDYWLRDFQTPRQWGLGIFLVEYPGYGRSGGAPSEASITATMLAAYDHLAGRPEIDAGRIIGYGRSLGTGAVCGLARDRRVAALVLESAFTSVSDLAWRAGLPGFLVRDPFDNLSVVRDFDGPALILHGERDEHIPVDHSRRLDRAARRSKLHVFDCGHNDCPRPWTEIRSFLIENSLARPASK